MSFSCSALRCFGWITFACVTWIATTACIAVPPEKAAADNKKSSDDTKGEVHPADAGKLAPEKIAGRSAEGEQAMSSFRKPEGWQVSLFAAEPELANPVALFVDRLGRVFVCESFRQGNGVTDNRGHDKTWLHADLAATSVADRIDFHRKLLGPKAEEYTAHDDRIRLLIDTNGDQVADTATVFADHFNQLEDGTGAGVLEHNGDVFFTCIPKLWRLRDKNNDGVADERTALYDGFGVRVAFRGHDMHGLVIGPDGRLYFSIGDRGYNVKTDNGTYINPESGAVFRCELDGSKLEIFATGLRNPQELAFDDYGNLFTGDNNSDSGDKARWVNVLEGGDTGWRMMYQYISDRGPFNREKIWHPYSSETPAYVVPPVDNIADGPSGLTYYPGTGLGDEYQNCFMLVDFRGGPSNSGIRLVKVKAKGAFWEIDRNEQLIWNILATDADFGPDGALWVCDWVDGWVGEGKGRVYRFFNPSTREQAIAKEVERILKNGFTSLASDELGKMLRHADRRVRLGSQWELAARGDTAALAELAADTRANTTARLNGAWGLAQAARLKPQLRSTAVASLVKLLNDRDAFVRAAALQCLADSEFSAEQVRQASSEILKRLGDDEPRVRYFAAMACGKLHIDESLEAVCRMLEQNKDEDPAIRHAGIMALKGLVDSTRVVGLSKHASRSVRLAAVVALRKRLDPSVAVFLGDADVGVQTEAARAVHDVPELHGGLPQLARLVNQKGASDTLMHRALNANFRLGTAEAAQAIARVAADSECSQAMREEALEMLGAWSKPGNLDRVMNRHLPLPDRDAAPAMQAMSSVFTKLSSESEDLETIALRVAADLGVREAAPALEKVVKNQDKSSRQRVHALESLLKMDKGRAVELVRDLATNEKQPAVRSAALKGLTELDPQAAIPLLEKATQSESSIERQGAWDALADLDSPAATKIITRGIEQYIANKLPADVWMNVIEASHGRLSPEQQKTLADFDARQAEQDPLAPFRDCIEGGDAKAGEEIFMTRSELSCVRCHKVGNKGGEVGPALTEIGKTKDLRYLLEAIVNPDAKIAENFETAIILTDEDQVITGIVKQETKELVTIITAEGKTIEVPTDTITVRKKGKSSMPGDLIKHMSRRQLRDLVAYLGSLKGRRR